jgi:hypothetical protein
LGLGWTARPGMLACGVVITWLRRMVQRRDRHGHARTDTEKACGTPAAAEDALWMVEPPDGVRLVRSRPARTGEGGRGVVAWYSDGTTASAMVNSDGSICVLFFRDGQTVPAIAADGDGRRFTWQAGPASGGRCQTG